eukprot:15341828-Alexandrium_andersonii.AAC.1
MFVDTLRGLPSASCFQIDCKHSAPAGNRHCHISRKPSPSTEVPLRRALPLPRLRPPPQRQSARGRVPHLR